MARYVIDTAEMGIDEITEERLYTQLQRVVLDHAVEANVDKPWVRRAVADPAFRRDCKFHMRRMLARLN